MDFLDRDAELDVVLLDADRRRAFVAEVRWSRAPVPPALLDDLRARTSRIAALSGLDLVYAVASGSGFRSSARRTAADERLIDLRRGVARAHRGAGRTRPRSPARGGG